MQSLHPHHHVGLRHDGVDRDVRHLADGRRRRHLCIHGHDVFAKSEHEYEREQQHEQQHDGFDLLELSAKQLSAERHFVGHHVVHLRERLGLGLGFVERQLEPEHELHAKHEYQQQHE